ncbi:MAG: MotA/TolQ/ExbB proton channel family protein [Candidatus Omnitrophota bacterium]
MNNIIQQGGVVMYPLIALSFVAIAVITERIIFWIRIARWRDVRLVAKIMAFAEDGDYDEAARFGAGTRDFIACTLLNGIRHRFYSLPTALETQAIIELKKMRKNLVILDTTITVAPLLGILGTVIGIILSFGVLGTQGIADPKAVTQGISQALITTAYGLSVALVTIFPYNYFTARCEDATEEMEKYASTLEMLHEKNKHTTTDTATRVMGLDESEVRYENS